MHDKMLGREAVSSHVRLLPYAAVCVRERALIVETKYVGLQGSKFQPLTSHGGPAPFASEPPCTNASE